MHEMEPGAELRRMGWYQTLKNSRTVILVYGLVLNIRRIKRSAQTVKKTLSHKALSQESSLDPFEGRASVSLNR
jgi:hypothetical protein